MLSSEYWKLPLFDTVTVAVPVEELLQSASVTATVELNGVPGLIVAVAGVETHPAAFR